MIIKVFSENQPIISEEWNEQQKCYFGLNRDRYPDNGWGEFRKTRMEPWSESNTMGYKEVELDFEEASREVGYGYEQIEYIEELKQILVEDICEYYGSKAYSKLKEFGLLS